MDLHRSRLFGGKIEKIFIVDGRALERECFVRGIEVILPEISVEAFSSVADFLEDVEDSGSSAAVFYNTGGRRVSDPKVSADLGCLAAATSVPLIVLSPLEEIPEMIAALDCGAKGYIPASLGIEATLTAVHLTATGAIFMPAASLLAMREMVAAHKQMPDVDMAFTSRQNAVADALRRGKPNKLIAYELNMCESTVKVHIRNIMKKLQARNRTEAAYKLNAMLPNSAAQDQSPNFL